MGISFGSINTGLPKDIVKQIVAAERIPIMQMQGRKGKIEGKEALLNQLIKSVEAIRNDLATNGNARSLRELSVDTNEAVVDVTVDKNVANPGSYQLEVVQLARKSSAMTTGFEDRENSYLGVGFIRYNLPNGESKDIYIDEDNSSLDKVAKLINKNDDFGMTATVVNDGSGSEEPWRMILSLKETGDENKVDFPYFYFVDGDNDFELEQERPAQDAKVKIDGFEVELPANKTSDLISGATIDLKRAKPGEEFELKISENTEAVATKIEGIIEKVNAVLTFIKTQNTMDETTDTSTTLGGDSILQSIESRLRSLVFQTIKTNSGQSRVGEIGVSFKRDGLLEFDKSKFEASLKENYTHVTEVLTGTFDKETGVKHKGFMDNLNETTKLMLRYPDGVLNSRRQGMKTKISDIDRRIANTEKRIKTKEEALKQKFARLEGTISQIKNQGAGLSALGSGGMNPVQQLG